MGRSIKPYRMLLSSNVAVGNSKVFTVPAGRQWEIESLLVTVTTTATAGNRSIRIQYKNAAGTLYFLYGSATLIAASITAKKFLFPSHGTAANLGNTFAASTIDAQIIAINTLPVIHLQANDTLTIDDYAAKDVNDTFACQLYVEESNAPSGLSL